MHNKFLTYALFIFFAIMLSIGTVIAVFTDMIPSKGCMILLCAVPLTALILVAAKINQTTLIPNLLIRQKYIAYIGCCLFMGMMIPFSGLALEYGIRHIWQFPYRIQNYLSYWILVDSFSTSALVTVIFLGMGVRQLFFEWQKEAAEEGKAAKVCSEAIDLYNRQIKAPEILDSLKQIKLLAETNADEANRQLRNLSTTLRHELYDMPRLNVAERNPKTSNVWLLEFISEKRYSWIRNLSLIILIACISITAIFDAPDRPDLTLKGLWAFLGMFFIICLVTYGNKSLCKYFLHKGKIKKYILDCGVFLCGMTVAMIVVESISYVHTIHNSTLPLIYTILATLSSICTLTLYLCGVTALVLLNYWLRTEHRTIMVKAETAKTELQFLQSQINPHFLFNVLNNIGILIYEMPNKASEMLVQLSEMFEYQMKITHSRMVDMSDEVDFLHNYLLLEESRKSNFNFSLMASDDIEGVKIPSLLLIPFVENASKHSTGTRDIVINISLDTDKIYFLCSNNADPSAKQKSPDGGLGIANTRRRLDLLYGSDYTLRIEATDTKYKISLIIPKNYEMYNS